MRFFDIPTVSLALVATIMGVAMKVFGWVFTLPFLLEFATLALLIGAFIFVAAGLGCICNLSTFSRWDGMVILVTGMFVWLASFAGMVFTAVMYGGIFSAQMVLNPVATVWAILGLISVAILFAGVATIADEQHTGRR